MRTPDPDSVVSGEIDVPSATVADFAGEASVIQAKSSGQKVRITVLNQDTPTLDDPYVYRGVHEGHPKESAAELGRAEPGDPEGTLTALEHNLNADDPLVQAESPFTSWSPDPYVAAEVAGENGLVLRTPKDRVPEVGEEWVWVNSAR